MIRVYIYPTLQKMSVTNNKRLLLRLCEPRIGHFPVKEIASAVKQSSQLVNVEIASPAITFIQFKS